MPGYNVPSYTTSNISIGPGVLYLASAGTTPTTDVGAVRGGELSITREKLDRMAAGSTIEIDIWKANGSGELTTSFGDDVQEFPYAFAGLNSTTDWASATLDSDKTIFQMRRIN